MTSLTLISVRPPLTRRSWRYRPTKQDTATKNDPGCMRCRREQTFHVLPFQSTPSLQPPRGPPSSATTSTSDHAHSMTVVVRGPTEGSYARSAEALLATLYRSMDCIRFHRQCPAKADIVFSVDKCQTNDKTAAGRLGLALRRVHPE